jgi:hypothetical protein
MLRQRAGAPVDSLCESGGKRWLLLRRWKTVRGSKRAELQALFAANRRLFKAYVLREQLDRLWTYKTRTGVPSALPKIRHRSRITSPHS